MVALAFVAFFAVGQVAGGLAAIPFAAHATLNRLGQNPRPGGPIATTGYIVFSIAVISWIIHVLRNASAAGADPISNERKIAGAHRPRRRHPQQFAM